MSKRSKEEVIQEYRGRILSASKEAARKELFQGMLNELFGSYEDAQDILKQMQAGAEKRVVISGDQKRYGHQDSQYANIIIEFERDLKKTGEHAKDQLHEYVLGNIKQTHSHDYVLIATDCIDWQLYAPQLENGKNAANPSLSLKDVTLKKGVRFTLSKDNAEAYFYFLDRYIFGTEKIRASLQTIQESFGALSQTFTSCLNDLQAHYETIKDKGHIQVAYDEWQRFLSISYGSSFHGGPDRFLVHSYLSMLARLIAYEVLKEDESAEEEVLRGILTGKTFQGMKIENLVERDFFYWIGTDLHFQAVLPSLRRIQRELWGYNFSNVREDILKGIYQELIDEDTRHELGEFYTPDWLCERMIEHFAPQREQRAMDPSCGSGSFLRAWVQGMHDQYPDMSAEELLESVVGIDIHPLAMQIAKVTLILSTARLIKRSQSHLRLPVYLANTLYIPEDAASLFGGGYKIFINQKAVLLSEALFQDLRRFEIAIEACDKISAQTCGEQLAKEDVKKMLLKRVEEQKRKYGDESLDENLIDDMYRLYQELKDAKDTGRDSLWRFIIEHNCRPVFLKAHKFDYVIGNPPWLTYKGIAKAEYQEIIKKLALELQVVPSPKNVTHMEMSAIFLAYTSYSFLKPGAKIGFVLPRSFLSADQHENTRNRQAKGFKLEEIWDMDKVKGLFNVPACVLFGVQEGEDQKEGKKKNIPYDAPLRGLSFSARIPEEMHDAKLSEVRSLLQERETKWNYVRLGEKHSAFSEQPFNLVGDNAYHKLFKQGATITPRSFYFIEPRIPIVQMEDKVPVDTDPIQLQNAKSPWKEVNLHGSIEPPYFFCTLLAKNILPFAQHGFVTVTLPIEIEEQGGAQRPQLLSIQEIQLKGHLEASAWYTEVDQAWEKKKKQGSKMSFHDRLNYQRGLTQQQLDKPFVVLYNTSAKDANAVVVQRSKMGWIEHGDRKKQLPFIVDTSTYAYYTESESEAYYLTSFLNAGFPNLVIKAFQAKGLFGFRHVHKKILRVPLPKYEGGDELQVTLADLGRRSARKAADYLKQEAPSSKDMKGTDLGRLRKALREEILHDELTEIDEVLKEVIQQAKGDKQHLR